MDTGLSCWLLVESGGREQTNENILENSLWGLLYGSIPSISTDSQQGVAYMGSGLGNIVGNPKP